MPPEILRAQEKPAADQAENKPTGFRSLCNEVYDFGRTAVNGFGHEVVKPLVGVEQIVTGKPGAVIDPKSPDSEKAGYVAGSMAGQALDFLAVQLVAKKIGWNPRATTIITSGALAALAPTESGGLSLTERTDNFLVGASSMAIYEGMSTKLKKNGLGPGLAKGLLRESSSGAVAGLWSAQSNSLLKHGEFADARTSAESMLGWAVTSGAFHAVGVGAGKVKAEIQPEIQARMGKLEPTKVEGATSGSTREFVMTSGKEHIDAFKTSSARGTTVTVRELLTHEDGTVKLGDRQKMLVQHLSATEGDGRLLKVAKTADIIASCHPERLSEPMREKHAFSTKEGNIWLFTGENNRLMLSAGDTPVQVTNVNGYKEPFKLNRGDTTIHAMAPLLVGNPNDMSSEDSQRALADFRRQLVEAKKLGIDGISLDMWWGMINKEKGKYDFAYYHALTDEVIKAGLDVATVLSFHKCGGNVGDTENINLPEWIWKDIADKLGSTDLNVGKYKSEQGNYSSEYIQLWADKVAVNYYADVMGAFRESFAHKAPYISEVNISLGPSGEMRYPSYNPHDVGTGYPTRGGFQGYSDLAVADFKRWALAKYGTVQGVGGAWNIKDLNVADIKPPSDANGFFDRNDHQNTQYGRDLIDWYNESLVNHGKVILTRAQQVLGASDSPFLGTAIGAKIPGVHWRMGWRNGDQVYFSDRKAEVNAGLITTSTPWTEENAYGYKNILNMLKQVQPLRPGYSSPVIPSYTCLELPDGQDGPDAQSLPHTAATRFGQAARKLGLSLKGENALSGTLYNGYDWDLMDDEVITPLNPGRYYSGLTLLRLHDVVDNPIGREKVTNLIQAIHANPARANTISPAILHQLSQPPAQVAR